MRTAQVADRLRGSRSARAAALDVSAGTSTPFSPSRSRSRAAPTRSERTSGRPHAAASLTTTPHGSCVESSAKTSAATYASTTRSQGRSPANIARTPSSAASASSRAALGPVADERRRRAADRPPRRPRAAACRRPFSGASRATESDGDVVSVDAERRPQLRPATARADRHARPRAGTSIVFANTRTRAGSAPSATTDSRASEPTTSTLAAPFTSGGTTVSLTRPPPAGLRARVVALDEEHVRNAARTAPAERRLRGERAPAGDDDDVGPARAERTEDPGRDRVVVAEDAARRREADAVQEDRTVPELDRPRAAGDGPRRVDHGQVDLARAARPGRGAAPGTASARARRTRRGSPHARASRRPCARSRASGAARRGCARADRHAARGSRRGSCRGGSCRRRARGCAPPPRRSRPPPCRRRDGRSRGAGATATTSWRRVDDDPLLPRPPDEPVVEAGPTERERRHVACRGRPGRRTSRARRRREAARARGPPPDRRAVDVERLPDDEEAAARRRRRRAAAASTSSKRRTSALTKQRRGWRATRSARGEGGVEPRRPVLGAGERRGRARRRPRARPRRPRPRPRAGRPEPPRPAPSSSSTARALDLADPALERLRHGEERQHRAAA